MRNNEDNEMEKCWHGCQFYHLEEITYLSGPPFLNLYERRSLSLSISSPITRQSLFKEFSTGTCPGKVSLMKQDRLKPGNLIHLRIKIVLTNIVQSPKLLVHVCLCVCAHKTSISQVVTVLRTATCLGPQWWPVTGPGNHCTPVSTVSLKICAVRAMYVTMNPLLSRSLFRGYFSGECALVLLTQANYKYYTDECIFWPIKPECTRLLGISPIKHLLWFLSINNNPCIHLCI